ncbi:GNAT family N-acetyltransferase [Enhygromyxa salina]|nr:GNAT family N-acetyltransferase [Enhygromyxa salina]
MIENLLAANAKAVCPHAHALHIDQDDPHELILQVAGAPSVHARDDVYSDRIRCDHPGSPGGASLGRSLLAAAEQLDRGRVIAFVRPAAEQGLKQVGFEREGLIPGFYEGEVACAVMGAYPDASRGDLAHPREVAEVKALLAAHEAQLSNPDPRSGPRSGQADASHPRPARPRIETHRATVDDAAAIASLLDETFSAYPTPSGDPEYVAAAIADGTPFRVIEERGRVVACASADLIADARTAELTDCATRPSHRGRGLMQNVLLDLMDDLRALDYPTAFTLARARVPGVNLAFARLGFSFNGTMRQSCRIGEGIEDMNIMSRRLDSHAG